MGTIRFRELTQDFLQARTPGQRGRPRKYGAKLSLSNRASHPDGWQSITYHCRGVEVTREYKTFLAMSHLADKLIRVVLVRFDDGSWVPYFCTDPNATVRDILEAAADRWAIEEHFHDVKEIWGAGQQQVRNVWSNIGCWHLNQWLHTLVELASWDESSATLVNRTARPWDNANRRPSHADRRRTMALEILHAEFPATLHETPETPKILQPCRIAPRPLHMNKGYCLKCRVFSEMLQKTLTAYHNRAIATQEVIDELIQLAKEMQAATQRGEDLGLNEDEICFYDALAMNESAVQAMGNDELKVIAAELVTANLRTARKPNVPNSREMIPKMLLQDSKESTAAITYVRIPIVFATVFHFFAHYQSNAPL